MSDTFPKSGRVTEVCKEWLVREDNALAQHLQTKEISEHYRGNRQRNQLVREDFPRALGEQEKELAYAELQAVRHQLLTERDELVARQLSDRLAADAVAQQAAHDARDAALGRHLQAAAGNAVPLPPKQQRPPTTHRAAAGSPSLNYVSLDLPAQQAALSGNGHHQLSAHPAPGNGQRTQYTEIVVAPTNLSPGRPSQYDHLQLQSHTPEKPGDALAAGRPSGSRKALVYRDDEREPFHANDRRHRLRRDADVEPNPVGGLANGVQKLSLEKYDRLVGNDGDAPDTVDGQRIGRPLRPADDEWLYVQCSPAAGKPDADDEIVEINRMITQQERDEQLARTLQQQENASLTFEEHDRLVAMEAQDKELARMLQQREHAKAKRAKERARLKKQAQKAPLSDPDLTSDHVRRSPDEHSYASPVDCLQSDEPSFEEPPLPERKPRRPANGAAAFRSMAMPEPHAQHPAQQRHSAIVDENYSSPLDLIADGRPGNVRPAVNRRQALGAYAPDDELAGDADDIYHLPVNERSNQLDVVRLAPNHGTRSHSSGIDPLHNIAAAIDPTFDRQPHSAASTPVSMGAGALPDFLDHSVHQHQFQQLQQQQQLLAGPVPPYMPIQGTRRSDGSAGSGTSTGAAAGGGSAIGADGKKRKPKDGKCTHQ